MCELKVIIAGGREFDDYHRLEVTMSELGWFPPDICIISGGAPGADTLGERWAREHCADWKRFNAAWDDIDPSDPRPLSIRRRVDGSKYNAMAGHNRNEKMAKYADVLIAFWDGKSKGTKNMIDLALRHGLEVHVYRYGPGRD